MVFVSLTGDLCVCPQYPGVAQSINSDVNNLMAVLSMSNALPDGKHSTELPHWQSCDSPPSHSFPSSVCVFVHRQVCFQSIWSTWWEKSWRWSATTLEKLGVQRNSGRKSKFILLSILRMNLCYFVDLCSLCDLFYTRIPQLIPSPH